MGHRLQIIVVASLAGLTAWAYWPTFVSLTTVWHDNAQYSHGYLVPPFAAYLLWLRRDQFPTTRNPAPLSGGLLLLTGIGLHTFAGWRFAEWPESISLLPYLLGLTATFGGWAVVRWVLPAVGFLAFMVPLPYRIEVAMGAPLQSLATTVSTFVLQTLGQPAVAEGNTILLREVRLGVVEACSGLKMLVTFVTFATAVCLVVKKPLSDKLVILVSAIPISLAVNVIRIVLTGIMYLHVSGESAKAFYHDLAGWIMMPLALAFLGLELWVLQHLIIEQPARLPAR
ncbi:MAG: exosortase/archaeosortase family protein [Gemmataceae bacterium]